MQMSLLRNVEEEIVAQKQLMQYAVYTVYSILQQIMMSIRDFSAKSLEYI